MAEIDISSNEWLAYCHTEDTLWWCAIPRWQRQATIRREIKTAPLGSFSLSGNQDKLSAVVVLILDCPVCDLHCYVNKNDDHG